MLPWLLLLFIAVLDFGFYSYAAITTANAARVGALWTSHDSAHSLWDPTDPNFPTPAMLANHGYVCRLVLDEMAALPNSRNLVDCNSLPVIVQMSMETEAAGELVSVVSVQYQTVQMFPLPFLDGRLDITRTARMRVRR